MKERKENRIGFNEYTLTRAVIGIVGVGLIYLVSDILGYPAWLTLIWWTPLSWILHWWWIK